jgi:hypothetical protein
VDDNAAYQPLSVSNCQTILLSGFCPSRAFIHPEQSAGCPINGTTSRSCARSEAETLSPPPIGKPAGMGYGQAIARLQQGSSAVISTRVNDPKTRQGGGDCSAAG